MTSGLRRARRHLTAQHRAGGMWHERLAVGVPFPRLLVLAGKKGDHPGASAGWLMWLDRVRTPRAWGGGAISRVSNWSDGGSRRGSPPRAAAGRASRARERP